ncbi:hypothetical protein HaLaN_03563 [Haematococcus lacustris]|uniref:Uncharacterized protein n=1 Tax=Haematococcus lacustris TaxID=44745 RepID=A0A699YQW4_HAELA|nr:hypothetical protein HaLaN_03563 [Haematococcus lacustris]
MEQLCSSRKLANVSAPGRRGAYTCVECHVELLAPHACKITTTTSRRQGKASGPLTCLTATLQRAPAFVCLSLGGLLAGQARTGVKLANLGEDHTTVPQAPIPVWPLVGGRSSNPLVPH